MHPLKHSSIAGLIGLVALAPGLDAQVRSGSVAGSAWPASWSPDVVGSHGVTQQERLPVYDDAGVVIPFEAIQAGVDPDGLTGAFWNGLLGFTLGFALGKIIAPTDCGAISGGFQYYCSPREDALNAVLPSGIGAVLGVLGLWAGWNSDQVTWAESLARIRRERRLSRG